MRSALLILALTTVALAASAREYRSMKSYKRLTGNSELNKRDWLKEHRKNNTREWLQSCEFNISYSTGHYEYVTAEQRRDFYLWLNSRLREKGHEVYWVAMKAESNGYLDKIDDSEKGIGAFAAGSGRLVFDSTFSMIQKLYQQEEILKAEEALLWDRAMIQMEQEELIQPYFNRMNPKDVKKLNKMAGSRGFYAVGPPKKLKFTGDVALLQDRMQYNETILLPYVKGEPVRAYKATTESEGRTEKLERIGERREAEMDRELYQEYKEHMRDLAEARREERRALERQRKADRRLNVRAIEQAAKDPNKYY